MTSLDCDCPLPVRPARWTTRLPERCVEGGTLILPRSHLVDRYRAECLHATLPPRIAEGGTLNVAAGSFEMWPPERHWLRRRPRRESVPEGRWAVDLRAHAPENFAHFLNDHLPLFFHLADLTGLDRAKALLLVRPGPPAHVTALAALFGLELWPKHAVVQGPGVASDLTSWVALRALRTVWAQGDAPQAAISRAVAIDHTALPKKVFFSRRGTRRLENAGEIDAVLAARGFHTVYAEDYPVHVQLRLWREAEEVVAVHGAGIAPLMYCSEARRPRFLVELLPVGIMSDVFREVAHQVGVSWVGVQGRLRSRYVPDLYGLETDFTQYAFDDFTIDPASVEMALDLAGSES